VGLWKSRTGRPGFRTVPSAHRATTLLFLAGTFAVFPDPFASRVAAQAGEGLTTDPQPIRVFLDCRSLGCDSDHLRREISFVSWVRDSRDADVHVLVTSQATGGGGRELEFRFLGSGRREGVDLQLRRTVGWDDTTQQIRSALTRTVALALGSLAVGTEAGENLEVVLLGSQATAPLRSTSGAEAGGDPWRAWVFRVGANGSVDGESSLSGSYLSAHLSASRTTETWKFQLRADGNRSTSRFELGEDETIVSRREGYGARLLLVRSLGNHFSTGIRGGGAKSSFLNQDLRVQLAPAVEYSVFPYDESASRELVVRYSTGVSHYRYEQETIYGLLSETMGEHLLSVGLEVLRPWGEARIELDGTVLMENTSQNRVDLTTDLSWRVVRGLSVSVLATASHVANQRSLPSGGVTDEEILLRRREMATSFRYHVTLGFGYTFGSRFAGPVNPRLGS